MLMYCPSAAAPAQDQNDSSKGPQTFLNSPSRQQQLVELGLDEGCPKLAVPYNPYDYGGQFLACSPNLPPGSAPIPVQFLPPWACMPPYSVGEMGPCCGQNIMPVPGMVHSRSTNTANFSTQNIPDRAKSGVFYPDVREGGSNGRVQDENVEGETEQGQNHNCLGTFATLPLMPPFVPMPFGMLPPGGYQLPPCPGPCACTQCLSSCDSAEMFVDEGVECDLKKPRCSKKSKQLERAQKLLLDAQKMLDDACQKINASQSGRSRESCISGPFPPVSQCGCKQRKQSKCCPRPPPPWNSNPKTCDCVKRPSRSKPKQSVIRSMIEKYMDDMLRERMSSRRSRSERQERRSTDSRDDNSADSEQIAGAQYLGRNRYSADGNASPTRSQRPESPMRDRLNEIPPFRYNDSRGNPPPPPPTSAKQPPNQVRAHNEDYGGDLRQKILSEVEARYGIKANAGGRDVTQTQAFEGGPSNAGPNGNEASQILKLIQEIESACNDLCNTGPNEGGGSKDCINEGKLIQLLTGSDAKNQSLLDALCGVSSPSARGPAGPRNAGPGCGPRAYQRNDPMLDAVQCMMEPEGFPRRDIRHQQRPVYPRNATRCNDLSQNGWMQGPASRQGQICNANLNCSRQQGKAAGGNDGALMNGILRQKPLTGFASNNNDISSRRPRESYDRNIGR